MLTRKELKILAGLRRKKNRVAEGLFMVEGVRVCEELLKSGLSYDVATVYHDDELSSSERGEGLLRVAEERSLNLRQVKSHQLERFTHTVNHQGIAITVRLPSPTDHPPDVSGASLLVGLDRVSDPGNLGTLLRTAAWFGADALFLSPHSADVYNPKVVRAAAGALFHLQVVANADIVGVAGEARKAGIVCVAAVADGGVDPLKDDLPGRVFLLLGREAEGLSEALLATAELRVTIPRFGTGESLNVGVAAGIIAACIARR